MMCHPAMGLGWRSATALFLCSAGVRWMTKISAVFHQGTLPGMAAIAKDVVLAYPGTSKVFEVYMDASSAQFGSVITQFNKPLTFFSKKKLSEMQQKCSETKIY